MTLHIFNPDHDLALAHGARPFTAPHAARRLRADLGFLPALWAQTDDCVLVEDRDAAQLAMKRLKRSSCKVCFVERAELQQLHIDEVSPWGWDDALAAELLRANVDGALIPSRQQIDELRELSSRETNMTLLTTVVELIGDGVCGVSAVATSLADIADRMGEWGDVVVKAPWSSSGRGVRFFSGFLTGPQRNWCENMIDSQGLLTVEPCYDKVKDFGMEFYSDGRGHVSYLGLSLFHNKNGVAYEGNLLASETTKLKSLSRYVDTTLIEQVRQAIVETMSYGLGMRYCGPFGIDMMVVRDAENGRNLLHPCVEVNVRRTMGHVALALSSDDDDRKEVMRIEYNGTNYRLKIERVK